MNLSIYRYKSDQGRLTRGIAFWLSTALFFYGCQTLFFFLHWDWATGNMMEKVIPIVNLPLSLGLIISVSVFLALEWFLIWMINRPKLGGLLIETETEMKKVSWPSWSDAFNSSLVVLIAVIFFMLFLGLARIVLIFIFDNIIFGG